MINHNSVLEILESNKNKKYNILVGFDGFVDEICAVVEERLTAKSYRPIRTISEYASKVARYAGLSMNIEIVPKLIKLGGNAPIMGNCLAQLDNHIDFIGAIGKKDIKPLFQDFATKCRRCFSLAEPGHTHALEFDDGKIMLGKIDPMNEITWDNIMSYVGKDKLSEILKNSHLIAITNWTLIFGMNGIIAGLTDLLAELNHRPYIFFDLSDPTKRDSQDLREGLFYISKMQEMGQVILGLNKNESVLISQILKKEEEDLTKRAKMIQEETGIYSCVIHDIKGAASAYEEYSEWIDGPFTPKPKLSTGAGDNFNAGFCYGLLSGLDPLQALLTGVCTSGYYVRQQKSPNREQLNEFIKLFLNNQIEE